MKKLEILLMALLTLAIASCNLGDTLAIQYLEYQGYEVCMDDIEPTLPLSQQILVCGGASELTATQIDSQVPAFNCGGEVINWWKWKKDNTLPGSGSVKLYDNTGTDYTNTAGYFTPDPQGSLEGYLSIVTEIDIISAPLDSVHYVHPQIDSPNPCLNGPNSTSSGASSTISIECMNWEKPDGSNVAVGDTIYFIAE